VHATDLGKASEGGSAGSRIGAGFGASVTGLAGCGDEAAERTGDAMTTTGAAAEAREVAPRQLALHDATTPSTIAPILFGSCIIELRVNPR
jgi:hypothetical protein